MGKVERKKSEIIDMTGTSVSKSWNELVTYEVDSRAWEMMIRSSWPFEKHFPDTLSFQALSK